MKPQEVEKILEEVIDHVEWFKDLTNAQQEAFRKIISDVLTALEQSVREDERTEIWKWCGENSWVQNDGLTEKGEIRVIDCDELADYWRKKERSPLKSPVGE